MQQHTITLYRAGGSWMARHSDPQVADLFGTDTIPTAYPADAQAGKVYSEIARRNPGVKVFVRLVAGK